jgi:hypothetical protein
MQKTKKFYKEIYLVGDVSRLKENAWNNFLLVGEKNWDYYFLPFNTTVEHEAIKDVEILEFSSAKKLQNALQKISKEVLINYCLDDKFYILKYA